MPQANKLRAHYVLSTHWDREWYQSYQNFRYQLVRLLDRVLAGIEDGTLKGPFQTDGQAIILEDYLEIRPDRRPQLERLAQAGKLVIGPWYVLPDEFLVSGESLVRNIRHGRSIARTYGVQPSNAGFVCDLFGHNSQMPQIFAGFGIHGGFIWRGLNQLQTRHVRWRAADGTEMIAYRFPSGGYCDYTFKVRRALEHGTKVTRGRVATDLADYLHYEAEHTEVDPILLFDGGDHEEWDRDTYAALVSYAGEAREDEFEIVHTSLDAYLAEVLSQAGKIGPVVQGELRESGQFVYDQQWVIPGVLSSRVWIKQANAECESLLCQWAEPTALWAHLALGHEVPQGFLDTAWRWLLKNHPHDSICGCSIDVVHEDMKYRFSQTRQIGNRLTREATRALAASVGGDLTSDELRVTVFNPMPVPTDEAVELELSIPTDWPTFNEFFGFEPKPAFRIFGPDGSEIPYQRLRQTTNRRKVRIYETKFPQAYPAHDVSVCLPLRIPALGYTSLTIRAERSGLPTRYPDVPGMATSERSMENDLLSVVVESNGTLTVTDKRTGAVYTRLLTFEDCADIGDGWYHGQAVNDQVFVSTASAAAVALVHNGPLLTTFRIVSRVRLPLDFHFDDRMARSAEFTDVEIDSLVSLRPGADYVDIHTTVHNTASDHRLHVLFPSGAAAATYLADTPFDVVERPIALSAENHLYRELETETRPQQSWSAVFAENRGLAIVSTGLLESAVRDLPERPIALTLLRSTRRTVMTDGEPGGLLLGPSEFRYRIVPLTGSPDRVHLFQLGQQLVAGYRSVQLQQVDLDLARSSAVLPPSAGFLALEGDVVMTSLRAVDAGVEIRLFNPNEMEVGTKLTWDSSTRFTSARRVDLESNPLDTPSPLSDRALALMVAPKKIVTLRFE